MVGVNKYIYKRGLEFWSFFPAILFMHEEKDEDFRYLPVSGKQFFCLLLGWYRDSFAPIGNSDRGFFYFSRKQILNDSEFYDKIINAYNFKRAGTSYTKPIFNFIEKRRMSK
ncbi:hypothetical protein COJ50_01270 [Bacillus cereus]|uniref:Uncharacterized protein n=1 Tax=Bacillus cereus TaxID=1396 RepID=A0A2B1KYK4_BACCE|nr:hypothetical protein COJ50_01270 [Bacillus cereus]